MGFRWRADVSCCLNGTQIVSGSTWETCDGTLTVAEQFGTSQIPRATNISTPSISTPVYLRMLWQYNQSVWHANWFYNYTGKPWTRFGSFVQIFAKDTTRPLAVEELAIIPALASFYQFGVASKTLSQAGQCNYCIRRSSIQTVPGE